MDTHRRPARVYLRVRRGESPGVTVELNRQLLKPTAPPGCWTYPETVPDPLELPEGNA